MIGIEKTNSVIIDFHKTQFDGKSLLNCFQKIPRLKKTP